MADKTNIEKARELLKQALALLDEKPSTLPAEVLALQPSTTEAIRAAAIKINNDITIEGENHAECLLAMRASQVEQGFVTTTGRFVDRVEADKIAFEAGMIKIEPDGLGLISEQIFDNGYLYNQQDGYYLPLDAKSPINPTIGIPKCPKCGGGLRNDPRDGYDECINPKCGWNEYAATHSPADGTGQKEEELTKEFRQELGLIKLVPGLGTAVVDGMGLKEKGYELCDLIDRLRAENKDYKEWGQDVKRLTKQISDILHPDGSGPAQPSLCDVVAYIRDDFKQLQFSLAAAKRQGIQWISVKERLPEKHGIYLFLLEGRTPTTGFFDNDDKSVSAEKFTSYPEKTNFVTHWAETNLPEK